MVVRSARFLYLVQRYYQTLTLKRHPGGRSSWCPFYGYAPFLVCNFRHISTIAVFFRFLPGKMPLVIQPGKGRLLPHSTPKTYSKRFFLSLFPDHTKTRLLFSLVRRFLALGGIKLYLKRKSPLRGFLGLIRAYCILRHRKRRIP